MTTYRPGDRHFQKNDENFGVERESPQPCPRMYQF